MVGIKDVVGREPRVTIRDRVPVRGGAPEHGFDEGEAMRVAYRLVDAYRHVVRERLPDHGMVISVTPSRLRVGGPHVRVVPKPSKEDMGTLLDALSETREEVFRPRAEVDGRGWLDSVLEGAGPFP